jgi:hypothetical protein
MDLMYDDAEATPEETKRYEDSLDAYVHNTLCYASPERARELRIQYSSVARRHPEWFKEYAKGIY